MVLVGSFAKVHEKSAMFAKDKLNFKKVRGSMTEMMLPKFETIAITTDIRIIGM